MRHDKSLPGDLVERLWSNPASLLDSGEVLYRCDRRRLVRLAWNELSYVIKHYQEPKRRHALKSLLRPSRARTTWETSRRLVALGVPTPPPVAYVENRWGPLCRDSHLMYAYVEGNTLRQLFEGEPSHAHDQDSLSEQFTNVLSQVEQLGAVLGDPNLGNFVVAPEGRLWVIDHDKTLFPRSNSAAEAGRRRGWKALDESAHQIGAAAQSFVNLVRHRKATSRAA